MNEFLTKITSLFSKDILFAALLPALLFVVAVSGVLLHMLGFNNVIIIYDGLSSNTILFLTFASILVLIVMAYVLHSIRDSLLRLWSGESILFGWVFWPVEQFHIYRFRKHEKKIEKYLEWIKEYKGFTDQVRAIYGTSKITNKIPSREEKGLLGHIGKLSMNPLDEQKNLLIKDLLGAYQRYRPSSLESVYSRLFEWNKIFDARGQTILASRDREYGSIGTIKRSYLGNVIQSYNEYSFKRYRMEPEVFWPRLQLVMKSDYKGLIQDHRITLDFAVTSCTLSLIFSLLCAAGPYFYTAGLLWLSLGMVGLLITFLCYRMAISAAATLGHLVRSSYDLFRLKLIKELNLKFPKNTAEEQEIWTSYSQFVTYGESAPLDLIKYEKED